MRTTLGNVFLSAVVTASNGLCCAQLETKAPSPDPTFREKAFEHVVYLAGLNTRLSGSEGEAKAIAYVKQQLQSFGLAVEVEPFDFESFTLERAVLTVGSEKIEPTLIAFNPHHGLRRVEGEAVFVEPETIENENTFRNIELKQKIVITTEGSRFWPLAFKKPKAIVFISRQDSDRLKTRAGNHAQIVVEGKVVKIKSANVVGTLAGQSGARKEIIISAHLDSFGGPGADDNASGVGVLLELARHFSRWQGELSFQLRFITFGAEELGFVGSKVYLHRHREELRNCELLFNIDTVGGSEKIYMERRGGVQNVSQTRGQSQLSDEMTNKAWHDSDGRWRLLHPDVLVFASNVPDWLQTAISRTAEKLRYEINPGYQMGSDHLVFAQAGIAATNITVSGNEHNSAQDTPERVNIESLEKVGRIVVEVVWRIMNRY